MTSPDPIRAAIERAEIAGQEIEALSAQLEALRRADGGIMLARLKVHWDFYWTAVERKVRRQVAQEVEVDYHHAQYADMLAAAQTQAEGEIESAVRQQIAMEIESAECEVADQSGGYVMACCARRRQDAAIARGGAR